MNAFEKEVQSKRNDFLDSIIGFVVAFGFFATLFVIANVIDVFSVL